MEGQRYLNWKKNGVHAGEMQYPQKAVSSADGMLFGISSRNKQNERLQLPRNIASRMESVCLSYGLSLQGLTLAIKGKHKKYTVDSLVEKLDAECAADIQTQQILGSTLI